MKLSEAIETAASDKARLIDFYRRSDPSRIFGFHMWDGYLECRMRRWEDAGLTAEDITADDWEVTGQ